MEWPFDETGEFRNQLIEYKDFTGTTIRESRLKDVRFTGVEMVDAEIDGYIENLVVNGVEVTKLVEDELDRRHPVRVALRSTDPDELRDGWSELLGTWDETIARARKLTEAECQQRVDDEWSVTETLRHLVFVVDSWFSRSVLGEPRPYHPAGLSPSFMTGIEEMGIDTGAAPSFDEAVQLWHDRSQAVSAYLASATADALVATCEPNDGPLWPPITEGTQALRCLRVVFDETWAHHQFALRDLVTLTTGANEPR